MDLKHNHDVLEMIENKILKGVIKYKESEGLYSEISNNSCGSLFEAEAREKGARLLLLHCLSCILCILNFQYNIVAHNFVYFIPIVIAIFALTHTNDNVSSLLTYGSTLLVGLYTLISTGVVVTTIVTLGYIAILVLNFFYWTSSIDSIKEWDIKRSRDIDALNNNSNLLNTAINFDFSKKFILEKILTLENNKVYQNLKESVVKRYNDNNENKINL